MKRSPIRDRLNAGFKRLNARAESILKRIKQVKNLPILILLGVIIVALEAVLHFGSQLIGLPDDWTFRALRGTNIAYMRETFTPTATSTLTATPTPTATFTSSVTFTPSPTFTATATPMEGDTFDDDVIGVVLADFVNDVPGVNSLVDPLALAFEQQHIPYIRVHHTLADRTEAQQISQLYHATIVVWGEKYALGVLVNFEIDPQFSQVPVTVSGLFTAVDHSFSAFVIYDGMGIPYLLEFTQGQMLLFDGDFVSAVDTLTRAVNRIPAGRESEVQAGALFFYRGLAYHFQRMDDAELLDLNHALELQPDLADAYNNRGNIYLFQGKYDEAIVDFNRAIELRPEWAYAYMNRGNVYERQHMYEEALADFNQAIQLAPDDGRVLVNRGSYYYLLGMYEEALADFNQAIQLSPDDSAAYTNRGAIYNLQGRYSEALADFNKAILIAPNLATSYNDRGYLYVAQGEYEKAINDFTHVIEINPNYANAYNNRGYVYAIQGDYEHALADIEYANQLRPNDPAILDSLGFVYAESGDYEHALDAYNRGLEIDPDSVDSYHSYQGRGNVNYRLGNYSEAIADYLAYQRLTGHLEPEMQRQIAEMEVVLTATPSVTEEASP